MPELKEEISLTVIDAKLNALKTSNINNRSNRAEIDRLKKVLNKTYINNKYTILEFEKTNYNHIAMMRSTHGFYKIFGHSALFYANDVAPKLGLTANLQTDGDFKAKSENGFISLRDPESLIEPLAKLGIKKIKTHNTTGDFILFKLPWNYTEDQIIELSENSHFAMRNFNHIVIVDNIIPILYVQITELTKAIYENVRGMAGPVEREAFGYSCIEKASEMGRIYIAMANSRINQADGFQKIKAALNYIKAETKILADLKIWSPRVCARIGDIIVKIQEILENETRRTKK